MSALRTLPLGVLLLLNLYARPSGTNALHLRTALTTEEIEPPNLEACKVYCYGPLLHAVQTSQLFADSKTFVDMKLKLSPEQTLEDFSAFMIAKNNTPTKDEMREFVNSHFEDLGKEFVPWVPNDWKESPSFAEKLSDPDYKQWGLDLNEIWKELGRKMIDDVHKNPNLYSIIPIKNPVIVPGGRFIEFYYWDSYWIIRGLLYSDMHETARGMLENFMSIIQRFGFIPNGGRIYYSKRSQPPLLAAMIKSYLDFTKDTSFAINSLPVLEHEFEFWMNNHTVIAKGFHMAAYGDNSSGPRPESYREDLETAKFFATDQEKEEYFSQLKAAAESGMDFSSRWFINEQGTIEGNLTNLKTRQIVPVELNAILYGNAMIIAQFHQLAGNHDKAKEFTSKAYKILEAIQAVHWNEKAGVWLDYDIKNNKSRNYFVPTNLSPLWMNAYNPADAPKISESIMRYIQRYNLDKFPGGVPNTLYKTGEQWDYPNVWPPMQYMLIEGLDNLNTPEARDLSLKWGIRWLKSNFEAYRETRTMFEKYDAERFGGYGGGGEYEIQKGFGWTNGIIIEYLLKYEKELAAERKPSSARPPAAVSMFALMTVAVPLIGSVLCKLW